jgi:putative tricarboxylic transport membrane protein
MAEATPAVPETRDGRSRLRAPSDLVAGLILLAVTAIALGMGASLDMGTMRTIGPGMLPRYVALLIGLIGLGLVVSAFVRHGEALGHWPLRGPFFVTLSVVAFAFTIRFVGLAVAGPLVLFIGGFASSEARPKELAIVAVVLTILCIVLFRFVLGLVIPVLIIPGVVYI